MRRLAIFERSDGQEVVHERLVSEFDVLVVVFKEVLDVRYLVLEDGYLFHRWKVRRNGELASGFGDIGDEELVVVPARLVFRADV